MLLPSPCQGALKALPQFMVGERAILEGLKKSGASNYTGALMQIPRPLRMMYMHAYQSYLWNAGGGQG
jgi:tRNA pseudouridine13 synthase